MYFFPALLGIIDIGFRFFIWIMRYPIAEDMTFGGALIIFSILFLLLSFAINLSNDISNNYRLGSTVGNKNRGGK